MHIAQVQHESLLTGNTPSLIIPNTKLLSNIVKVFVRTGPAYDGCENSIPVEIDLIENGTLSRPNSFGRLFEI